MTQVHVTLAVRNQTDIDRVRDALAEHARRSRSEPGCAEFRVFQSDLDSHSFFILEAWESQAALETHRLAEAFTTIYAPQVLPAVDRSAHVVTPLPD